MSKSPHCPAAFINALSEEGSRHDLIRHLQETWNDYMDAKTRLQSLEHELERARKDAERIDFVERVNPIIFHKSSADDQWEICIDPMAPVLKEGEQTFCGDTFRAALDSARRTSGDERG